VVCDETTAYRPNARWQASGLEAPHTAGPTGSAPRLSDAQLAAIDQALRQGAPAHGFDTDHWALARITSVIGPASGENCEPGGLVTERWPRTVPVPTGA
jgi:transposase